MGTLISILKRFINSDLTKPINTMIDEVKATLALIKAKTDTITADLFTSTHASRIDASISSRATQTTVDAIYSKVATGLGCVKSVQRGQITLAINTTSVNVTVSSVNMSKCMIIVSGSPSTSSTSGAGGGAAGVYTSVVSDTVFSIIRTTGASLLSAVDVGWQLVEYY